MMHHGNLYRMGDRSEDHLAKCAWAFIAMMDLEVTSPESNDFEAWKLRRKEVK